ncbi:MAG: YbjN domain-containing protein [Butyricicoccus pullicaecorum]|jgi:hypothetical protein|nr:YbjN domain-containing protein [Butyricicoccus pullicaecorum]
MAFDILSIAEVYKAENLNFSTEEERGLIRFSMNTEASPDVRFTARVVNPRTALFTTILPMNIPEKNRAAVSEYLTRVNYTLLLGNFQMDLSDGELSYKSVGVFEEESGLPDSVVTRLTYVGFNMFDKYIPGVFAIIYGGRTAEEAFQEIESKED